MFGMKTMSLTERTVFALEYVNSLTRRKPKKAKVKAAQSITVSSSSENAGRSKVEISDRICIVMGRRMRCGALEDRLMPFKMRWSWNIWLERRGLFCST